MTFIEYSMKRSLSVAFAALLAATALMFICSSPPADTTSQRERRPHETGVPDVPKSAAFCGEDVPLGRQYVYESLDREVIVNTFLHSNTLLILKRSGRIFPQIEPILEEMGVPEDMKYLCVAESNLVPTAKSPAGAAGLWQFMEGSARENGLRVTDDIDERLDVEKSTRAACRMLLSNYRVLGSWTLVAASYNGGLGRVRKVMAQQMQDSYYDLHWAEETRRYVFRIVALKTIMQNPSAYGFDVDGDDLYPPYEIETVTASTPIENLAQWAKDHGTSFRMLKELNPWIVKSQIRAYRDSLRIAVPRAQ